MRSLPVFVVIVKAPLSSYTSSYPPFRRVNFGIFLSGSPIRGFLTFSEQLLWAKVATNTLFYFLFILIDVQRKMLDIASKLYFFRPLFLAIASTLPGTLLRMYHIYPSQRTVN